YPWQRERYWIEVSSSRARSGDTTGHPLLGVRVRQAGEEARYESVLTRSEHGWIYDHQVLGQALLPGGGVGELVRAAAEHLYEGEAAEVVSLALQAPLVVPERGGQRVQVVLKEEGERWEASVYSQPAEAGEGAPWTLHASAEVRRLEVANA